MQKSMFYLLLSFLLVVSPSAKVIEVPEAVAWMGVTVSGGGISSGGGACDTLAESAGSSSGGSNGLGQFNNSTYMGNKFVTSTNATICAIDIYIEKDSSPSGDTYACIYSHDGVEDDPDSAIDCSDVVNANTWPADGSPDYFSYNSGLSASITNGTTYWVVVYHDGDGTNHGDWHIDNNCDASKERVVKDGDGLGTWSVQSTDYCQMFNLYK